MQQQQRQMQNAGAWSWTAGGGSGMSSVWEARAFAEDMGTGTWPPRSYCCTFCGREFRSAQALGGHMNVHRRDRARLRQSMQGGADPPTTSSSTSPPPSASPIMFPPSELVNGGSGLCLFYATSPHVSAVPPLAVHTRAVLDLLPEMGGYVMRKGSDGDQDVGSSNHGGDDDMEVEDLDLELRLGW